ncbi:response regulator transcription factor [Saccharicrinis sp. 156]|uniref:response regulator transcription factor n=1 Tax=Saccharicrinis sp. 156 TaxID=3417574 RepID=UPI003D333165
MTSNSTDLMAFKKVFGKQNYQILDDNYKSKLMNHPLINGIFTTGKSFVIIANTHEWSIELVTGDTMSLTGYNNEELLSMGGKFTLDYPIKEHIPTNMATVKSAMEYIVLCPVQQREMVFVIYYYKAQKSNGDIVTVQHQSIPLIFDEQKIPYIFCNIYTDISYLDATNIPHGLILNKSTGETFNVNHNNLQLEKTEDVFSSREKEIIRLLTTGYTSKKIADFLHISYNTVRTHRKNILNKAGVSNTASLLKYVMINGL